MLTLEIVRLRISCHLFHQCDCLWLGGDLNLTAFQEGNGIRELRSGREGHEGKELALGPFASFSF